MQPDQLKRMVLASLLAALTAIGAYIQIPIGPIPIVLTNLFVLLAGLLLGSRWALISMTVYVLTGAIGFPVFVGATGGMGHLFGPTGGYLFGFLLAGWLVGWISESGSGRIGFEVVAVAAGTLAIYALGVPWLKLISHMNWGKAIAVGAVPFLAGDAVKATAALLLARALRPIMERQSQPASA